MKLQVAGKEGKKMVLQTERLLLRNWKQSDLELFARMNSDPQVMEFFPKPLLKEESDLMAQKIIRHLDEKGWGLWAVELKDQGQFIGFVGLSVPMPDVPVAPAVEIGWRLAKEFWGHGYATEAAREVLKFAFENLELNEVISFTAKTNLRSQAVMQRIGLANTHKNFLHPRVPDGSNLREHVLFRLSKETFLQKKQMKKTEYLKNCLSEVSRRLRAFPNLKPGNHYNSPTPTLGISVPQSRSALKEGYSFLALPAEEILTVFDYIWNNAEYFEEMSQAVYFYEKKSLTVSQFKVISGWIDRCDNWAHSDGLSSIYARALEENAELVMPVLKNWNRAGNSWKRRQSVVSLLYYSRLRKRTPEFKEMIEMVEALLKDPEYYVQKGVGWTLREIYNLHPDETLDFIEKNVTQIAPAAWQASTEKLPAEIKRRLLQKRRSA